MVMGVCGGGEGGGGDVAVGGDAEADGLGAACGGQVGLGEFAVRGGEADAESSGFAALPLNYWVPANRLKSGERLKTPEGTIATADGGTAPKVHDGWMWDLTVPGNGDHDFYVEPAGMAATRTMLQPQPQPSSSTTARSPLPGYPIQASKPGQLPVQGTGNPNLIGDGTTMSAAQSEVAGGDLVEGSNHIIKAQESIRALSNWMSRMLMPLIPICWWPGACRIYSRMP